MKSFIKFDLDFNERFWVFLYLMPVIQYLYGERIQKRLTNISIKKPMRIPQKEPSH
jgi:hypothetical protein